MTRPKAVLSFSSGKDCATALHVVRQAGQMDVVAALCTTNEAFDRVAMHGTRNALLRAQVAAMGLDLIEVPLPWPCSNEAYEARMTAAMAQVRATGATQMIFGDLFLPDVRAYREEKLAGTGVTPVFPLWGIPTDRLARQMIADGFEAYLVSVDPRKLPASFAGRRFDESLLADLPEGIDPCGENGEFHTAVVAGPIFSAPIPVRPGAVVTRDGFVFADLVVSD